MGEEQQFERTEPATARRRKQFRDKGQVAKSKEVAGVLMLVGVLIYFNFSGEVILQNVGEFWRQNFELAVSGDLNVDKMSEVFYINAIIYLRLTLPFFALVMILSFFGNVVQFGLLLTIKPLMPDFSRVDPISKFKEIFLSPRIFSETGINVMKLTVFVVVLYMIITSKLPGLPAMAMYTPYAAARSIMETVLEIILKTIIFFVLVAIVDYLYRLHTHEKKMRMTKQEVKDEFKDMEGDPMMKGHVRARMREISMNKIIDTVPMADVVVTNPTHIAVALSYKSAENTAPRLVAKGKGFWAERIKEIARENKVEIVEDKLLARALYRTTKIGGEIPANLFRAVAELLAYIFNLKQNPGLRQKPPRVENETSLTA